MAKLYRVIPDTFSTFLTSGYLSDVSEDLMYKLGYLSCGDHDVGYFGTYEEGKGMAGESTNNYIFFFSSPWSCVKALNFFRDDYAADVARILEYDIPDDIIKSSKNAFTNYTNYQAKGKIIPVELLKENREVFTEFRDEFKSQLEQIILSDAKESAKSLNQSIQESQFSIHKNNSRFHLDSLKQLCSDSNRMQCINRRRLQKSGKFFKTDIITGKAMIVTRADREVMQDVIYGRKTEDNLSKIMKKSNGILTLENFRDYDSDVANHSYGIIYDYE